MIDKVTELEPGVRGRGIKNVTINEHFFQGHFPKEPIMPGVMIIECLAQLTALVYCCGILQEKGINDMGKLHDAHIDPEEIAAQVGYLANVNIKFRSPVVPGDQLILDCILGKSLGLLRKVKVSAKVNNTITAEGDLIVSRKE